MATFASATVAGGRKPLRDILFMAASCASRHNPVLKTFYDRLRQNGKPHKLTIVAVLRKLVTTLNAIVRAEKTFHAA